MAGGPAIRIYATCDLGEAAFARLRERGWALEVHGEVAPPPRAQILDRVRSGIAALITTLRDPIDAEVLEAGAAAGLAVVAQIAVGVDNIDRAAANRLRIPIGHTADVLTEATAEFAFFMLGAVARRTWPSEQLVREQQWGTWHPSRPWLGDEVSGRTVAVVGVGRIGRSFVRKAVGFDMDVLCVSPEPDPDFVARIARVMAVRHEAGLAPRRQQIAYVPLAEALERADFVSLHVPLVRPGQGPDPTLHLIDEAALRRMRPTAYLINTSRGPVVDEAALVRALDAGWIAGAALDVYEREPLPADRPLRAERLAPRLRLFHHCASAGRATRLSPDPEIGMAGRTVQAVIDVLEKRYHGDPRQMPYIINKEAF